ncbi:hypothetical protein LPJ61_005705, partial [Coemansia biformis]
MAGGRRRRRSSASSSASNARAAAGLVAGGQRPPPLGQESALAAGDGDHANTDTPPLSASTGNRLARLVLDNTDDPFAYDSELETLSSVSSHSSIGSTNSADLDRALSGPDDLSRLDGSDDEGPAARLGDCMAQGDRDSPGSADMAIHSGIASASSPKGDDSGSVASRADSDSDAPKPGGSYGRFMAKPARPGGSSTAARRRRPAQRAHRQRARAEDENSSSGSAGDGVESQATPAPSSAASKDAESGGDSDDAVAYVASKAASPRGPTGENGGGPGGPADSKEDADADASSSSGSDDEDAAANETRRSAALSELTCIEVEFAQLRERLYCERMQQVQIEEARLVSGRHGEYTRGVEEITASYTQHLARLKYGHEAWVAQRRRLHEAWIRTVNYTFLERRQELRRRLIGAQQRRIWRLRDMRIQEEERYDARMPPGLMAGATDEDLVLVAQQSDEGGAPRQMKHARRMALTAQRCLVHSRRHQLAAPGLDVIEMDADYQAMCLPVYLREPQAGFRHVFVPPLVPETGGAAGKKRKQRQPRQPRKRLALEKEPAAAAAAAAMPADETAAAAAAADGTP